MGEETNIAELRRRISLIERDVEESRAARSEMADLPRIIAEAVSAVVREELAKRR
jgi:hypothetical protein